jgi:hypothetical protein
LERVDISEWLSHGSLLSLSPYPSELCANSLAKLKLHGTKLPDAIHLGNLPRGIDTTFGLLRLLATSVFSQSRVTATALKRYVTPILDHNQRLWTFLMGILDSSASLERHFTHVVEHFFQGLQDTISCLSRSRCQSSVRQKFHSIWGRCIAEIFLISQTSSFTVMADEIISVLDITTEMSSQAPGLAFAVCEILQPTMKPVLDETIVQPVVYTRIQVR